MGLVMRLSAILFSLLLGLQTASAEVGTSTTESTRQIDAQKIRHRTRMNRRAIRHKRDISYVNNLSDSRRDNNNIRDEKERVTAKKDAQPILVLIEAALVQVKLKKDSLDSGVNFALLNRAGKILDGAVIDAAAGIGQVLVWNAGGTSVTGIREDADGLKFGGIGGGDTAGFIRALEVFGEVKVLASPRLLVINKQRANIHIGKESAYETRTANQPPTAEQIKLGTELLVRPYVAADGKKVRLEFHLAHSTGRLDEQGVPQATITQVTANVMIPERKSVAISGPIHNESQEGREYLSVLSRLPYVGLFYQPADVATKNQLLVLITPRIWKR